MSSVLDSSKAGSVLFCAPRVRPFPLCCMYSLDIDTVLRPRLSWDQVELRTNTLGTAAVPTWWMSRVVLKGVLLACEFVVLRHQVPKVMVRCAPWQQDLLMESVDHPELLVACRSVWNSVPGCLQAGLP